MFVCTVLFPNVFQCIYLFCTVLVPHDCCFGWCFALVFFITYATKREKNKAGYNSLSYVWIFVRFCAAIPFIYLFIYFSYPFSDKLANISGCIKNNKCPENESKSFFFLVHFSSSPNGFWFSFPSFFLCSHKKIHVEDECRNKRTDNQLDNVQLFGSISMHSDGKRRPE